MGSENKEQKADNYQVGYKKPPKEHQFKPGHSGNKRGRPIKRYHIRTLLDKEICYRINSYVTITEDGKKKKITVKEAISRRLAADAMSGKIAAIRFINEQTAAIDNEERKRDPLWIGLMEANREKARRAKTRRKKLRDELLKREREGKSAPMDPDE